MRTNALVDEASRERGKIMDRSRKLLEESKKFIVLPTRLTCCFPKGSVAPFLLETKMAVL
jgi:hypothetical protein